ncbi:hypothetical protein PoB_001858100 [Plakobranchus ocellatus]|uniref:Uncharacterized protein n=1 Tax=Plakobranchus ocellatus TaxID=259542 RepID=A0AAV3YYA8_9GAST|nr:hypothetical protein PoB_001858100 [Plakobranchus ocellatus]
MRKLWKERNCIPIVGNCTFEVRFTEIELDNILQKDEGSKSCGLDGVTLDKQAQLGLCAKDVVTGRHVEWAMRSLNLWGGEMLTMIAIASVVSVLRTFLR